MKSLLSKKLLSGLIVLSLGFSGCSLFGGTSSGEDAEKILKEGIKKSTEIEAASFEIKPHIEIKSEQGSGTFDITLTGKSDKSKKKFALNLDVNGDFDSQGMTGKIAASVSLITAEKNIYFKLNSFTLPESLKVLAGTYVDGVKKIEGTWYQVPAELMPEGAMQALETAQDKDDDNTKKIMEALKDADISVIEKDHGSEKISGNTVRHLTVKLSKDNIKKLIQKIGAIKGEEVAETDLNEIDQFFDTFTHSLDLWIGESDYLPYKMSGKLEGKDTKNDMDIKVTFNGKMWDFGKDQGITEPSETKSFTDLFQIMNDVSIPSDIDSYEYNLDEVDMGDNG